MSLRKRLLGSAAVQSIAAWLIALYIRLVHATSRWDYEGLEHLQAIRANGSISMVELDEVDDDALVIPTAMMGAPTVMVEKLPSGDEVLRAFEQLQHHLGRRAACTMSIEIGGLNSVIPLCLAARPGRTGPAARWRLTTARQPLPPLPRRRE